MTSGKNSMVIGPVVSKILEGGWYSSLSVTSGKNFMVIGSVVSEILAGGGTPLPDAITLSKRADAINC